jgi:3-hydroxy-9,10-secoandrosta-1,3,5(10)-triene-9,17-dione monooxygenase
MENPMADTVVKFDAKPMKGKAPHDVIQDYGAMLDRAYTLVPVLRSRADDTEKLRRLPPDTERDLHDAGLFRILQPRRVGGSEFDYVALIDFAAVLARGDASVAWNVANLASHHWMLGMFEAAAQDRVWSEDPNALIASSFVFPAGHATRAQGGFRLSGRWPFSSGVEASDWNILAGIVASEDEAEGSEYRVFLVHKSDYTIIDTWHSSGLRGTGSQDVELCDAFVPANMSLAVAALAGGPTPGSAVNPGTLFKLPVFALFPYVLAGIALGNAQACLEDYVSSARTRASKYTLAKLADFQSTQIKVAEASAKIEAAERIMRGTCIEAMDDAERCSIPDLLTKVRYRRDGAFAVNLCTEAVTLLFSASGAGALYTANALQRQFRDAHAVNAHIAFNFDAAGSNYGRVALGFPSENTTL